MNALDFEIDYFPEPLLEFRYRQRLAYPRDGLFLFGPMDTADQVRAVRFGVIGTSTGIVRFGRWSTSIADFIDIPSRGRHLHTVAPQHVPFPGFPAAFHADWNVEPAPIEERLYLVERILEATFRKRSEPIKERSWG
jgi:hypothetical protein